MDYHQNRAGQLMASTYCVRPKPGAPVSTPLTWDEVGGKLDLMDYTIETVPSRMEKLEEAGAGDACRLALTEKPDLLSALQHLHEKGQG